MDFLNGIITALVGFGPLGVICAMELVAIAALGYGLWYFVKQRSSQAGLIRGHATETKKLQDDHLDRLENLHNLHHTQLAQLNEKRIEDMKEATEDYSELATQLGETLNRLTLQLEIRGARK